MEKHEGSEYEKGCECEEEMTVEEMIESNHIMIHALIDLLVKKKIITVDEFDEVLDSEEEPDE